MPPPCTTTTTPTSALIAGRKVAVIGYGSQGHAHALNLQGLRRRRARRPARGLVVAGQGRGGRADACCRSPRPSAEADVIMILLPDTEQKAIYDERHRAATSTPGDALAFAHGFNIRFGQHRAARRASTWSWSRRRAPATSCAAPTPRAAACRASIAVDQDATGKAQDLALSYAEAIGGTRAGVIETTFAEETETDLFGEQVVLCGGAHRARPGRLRDAGRGRLPARDRPTSSACTR